MIGLYLAPVYQWHLHAVTAESARASFCRALTTGYLLVRSCFDVLAVQLVVFMMANRVGLFGVTSFVDVQACSMTSTWLPGARL